VDSLASVLKAHYVAQIIERCGNEKIDISRKRLEGWAGAFRLVANDESIEKLLTRLEKQAGS
jgi:hypothetical protein